MEKIILQITDPPADFLGFLLWVVPILVGVIGTMFYFLKSAMQSRIDDRDALILTLREEKKAAELKRDELIEEIKNSFDVANQSFQHILTNIKSAK